MTCPDCGAVYEESVRFCGACGAPMTFEKKGSHRVPILILIALSVLGICVFFATGGGRTSSLSGVFQDADYTLEYGSLYTDSRFEGITEITVPGTVGGQRVIGIGRYCFAECDDAVVIHLPDTIETIGEFAFAGCDSLRAMELPAGVREIGSDTFRDCPSLEAIRIPASVEYIGLSPFDGCSSLAFIFYDGTMEQWKALYPHDLGPDITVCCSDGNDFQAD